ncbi:MAG: hypothetical protein ACTSPV_12250 [Candidatus Hodarchaeales archaeon]
MEIYERRRGVKEKVKELIKGIFGRNINPLLVVMTKKKEERESGIKVIDCRRRQRYPKNV